MKHFPGTIALPQWLRWQTGAAAPGAGIARAAREPGGAAFEPADTRYAGRGLGWELTVGEDPRGMDAGGDG